MARRQAQAGLALVDDPDAGVAAYNEAAARTGWPRVQVINPSRRMALAARLRDCGGLEGWRHAMARAEASDFLRAAAWMSFDWLTQPGNLAKLMEGNYGNRQAAGDSRGAPDPRDTALRDRIHDGRYRRPSRGADF